MLKNLTHEQKLLAAEIVAAYLASGGNASATAVRVGRNRSTVQSYLMQWREGGMVGIEGIPAYEPERSLKSEVLQTADTSQEVSTPDWAGAMADWYRAQGLEPPVLPEIPAQPEQPKKHAHTESFNAPLVYAPKTFFRIGFLSDVHLRFEDKVNVRLSLDALADMKPDAVVLGGDIFDAYDISDYDRDPSRSGTLQDEFDEGRYFLNAIAEIAPKVVYLEGNHENRLSRLIGKNPGLYKLRSLEFPKAAGLPDRWEFYPSQTHYHIGKLAILHGDMKGVSERVVNPAQTLYRKLKHSFLCGHFHRFGRYFENEYHGTPHGGFTNGHLSDVGQVKFITNPNWQAGFSRIDMSADYEMFAISQYLAWKGRLLADGKEWSL